MKRMKAMHRERAKTVDDYMALPYTIELTPEADGGWFAQVPLLEGCMTNGENWDDALEMIHDAMRAWLTTAIELGLPIPEPQSVR